MKTFDCAESFGYSVKIHNLFLGRIDERAEPVIGVASL
jgi:hypothetical protein